MTTAKRPRIPARLAPVGTRHAPAITRQIPRLFSDEEILSLLNERAGSDGRLPRNAYAQTREHGEPTAHCIELRFGTWNQAIVTAGLIPTLRPVRREDRGPDFSDAQILDALRACQAATGNSSLRCYEDWRKTARGTIPSAGTIRARFGSWSAATAYAFITYE